MCEGGESGTYPLPAHTPHTTPMSYRKKPYTSPANPRVYMDLGGEHAGRLVFELFADKTPKTAFNFLALCRGSLELYPKPEPPARQRAPQLQPPKRARGAAEEDDEEDDDDDDAGNRELPLSYAGSAFTRIAPGFMMQGGLVRTSVMTPGAETLYTTVMADTSVFGESFDDESYSMKHAGFGTLAMAGGGQGGNASQFYVCFGETPWLDGQRVVFGHLVRGSALLQAIEAAHRGERSSPAPCIPILACGELHAIYPKCLGEG